MADIPFRVAHTYIAYTGEYPPGVIIRWILNVLVAIHFISWIAIYPLNKLIRSLGGERKEKRRFSN